MLDEGAVERARIELPEVSAGARIEIRGGSGGFEPQDALVRRAAKAEMQLRDHVEGIRKLYGPATAAVLEEDLDELGVDNLIYRFQSDAAATDRIVDRHRLTVQGIHADLTRAHRLIAELCNLVEARCKRAHSVVPDLVHEARLAIQGAPRP